jgi:hypothetical protein
MIRRMAQLWPPMLVFLAFSFRVNQIVARYANLSNLSLLTLLAGIRPPGHPDTERYPYQRNPTSGAVWEFVDRHHIRTACSIAR